MSQSGGRVPKHSVGRLRRLVGSAVCRRYKGTGVSVAVARYERHP
ncbi:hypothetical protein [Nostoc sp. MG11]|nr:hypothetical protein [Nostoc sp. MG11]